MEFHLEILLGNKYKTIYFQYLLRVLKVMAIFEVLKRSICKSFWGIVR